MNRKCLKYHGGEFNIIGIEYEIRFAIKKLVEMILPTNSGVRTTKLTRQKKEYVDDVVEEKSDNVKIFYQCKHYKKWVKKTTKNINENQLWLDFFSQHKENSCSELILVTQNKDYGFDDLSNLSRFCSTFVAFKQELENDAYHSNALSKFGYLVSLIKEENNEIFIFEFLQKFRIASYDDYFTKEDSLKTLKMFFSEVEAENIFNLFHNKLNSEWLGKEITRDLLISALKQIKITLDAIKSHENIVDTSVVPQTLSAHILSNTYAHFSEKLDYLLIIINNSNRLSSEELSNELSLIEQDDTLIWHFLKNLKDPTWFPIIKDNIIKKISEDTSDSAIKYQLLNYFEICANTYSDKILPLLYSLERNTQNYNILSSLVSNVGLQKPKSSDAIGFLWQILDDLVDHQHPWVRREIPGTLISFINIDEDKVLNLFKSLFTYSPPPQDVTQGSPTLALTFQGKDNEKWVFEETIKAFCTILSNPKYADKAFALALEVEKNALENDRKSYNKEQGIILDYSCIWLSNMSSINKEVEFIYDCKERLALEIEKSLIEIVKENKNLLPSLLGKMLSEKYEIFYLLVIRFLIKFHREYPEVSKSLVFDLNIWNVYNIRKYYLQTLANNYFLNTDKNDIAEFVKMINQRLHKNDRETLFTGKHAISFGNNTDPNSQQKIN